MLEWGQSPDVLKLISIINYDYHFGHGWSETDLLVVMGKAAESYGMVVVESWGR